MKILVTRKLLDSDIEYIKNGLDQSIKGKYEFVFPEEYNEGSLLNCCEDVDVFLGPFVTKKLLEKAKQLKLIQIPWTGMDTFDFESAKGFDVPICNTPSNADSVAEIGLALALDLIKKISYHDRKMRDGNWNRDQKPLDLKSRMLSNQKVCVLGCGNIGYRVAKLFNAFGSYVFCVDNIRMPDDIVREVFPFSKIKDALSTADVIVCCLPLTDETRNCINDDLYSNLNKRPYIINISRAAIFNEDELFNALLDGKLSGFASDVWWNAPKRGESQSYPSTHNEFWKLDNVILSPHRAGFVEGCFPHLDGAVENIINLCHGKDLKCVVDCNLKY